MACRIKRVIEHSIARWLAACGLLAVLSIAPMQATRAAALPPPPLNAPLLAFTAGTGTAIYLYDVSADHLRTLDFGMATPTVWDFSPDGCRLLFTADAAGDGIPLLYSVRLDGGDLQAMGRYDGAWGAWAADWSARGDIAFTLIDLRIERDGALSRRHFIAVMDGANPADAVTLYSTGGDEFAPRWSPDGAWLAYIAYEERVPGADLLSTAVPTLTPVPDSPPREMFSLLREADLWLVSVDGATTHRLTDFPVGSVRDPRWSPDGELISFIYSPAPNNDLFYMIAGRPDALTNPLSTQWNVTLDHTWRPDGAGLVASARNFQGVMQSRLWSIPLLGNADESATLFLSDNAIIYADYPRFSADGRYLAFRSEYAPVIYQPESGEWWRLSAPPGHAPPVWSPDAFAGESACG